MVLVGAIILMVGVLGWARFRAGRRIEQLPAGWGKRPAMHRRWRFDFIIDRIGKTRTPGP
jgi:hypothetical protein